MVSRRTTRGTEAPRLTDFIHDKRGEILATWESCVRELPAAKQLQQPALLDHIPALLERIAESAEELARGGTMAPPSHFSELHARERLDEGFDLQQVITEFAILREIITRLWGQDLLDVSHQHDLHVLNRAIDAAIAGSADRFTSALLHDRAEQAERVLRQTEVDKARLFQEARRAVRVREDVLAIVSHDLRNPLGAIDLSASMLLQTHSGDPRSRNQLEVIRRSVGRMEHMINDLLDMASIQAGRLSLKRQLEDARTLIEEAVDAHLPIAQEKRIRLEHSIALDGVALDCDRDRIAQVFGNLLGNALKFCRPGDLIVVRAFRDGDEARFDIQDSGPGIADQDLPHIFEPYWSAKREQSRGIKSTGLGLHICEAIVQTHGGRLWVESKLDQGATFSIALPIAVACEESACGPLATEYDRP